MPTIEQVRRCRRRPESQAKGYMRPKESRASFDAVVGCEISWHRMDRKRSPRNSAGDFVPKNKTRKLLYYHSANVVVHYKADITRTIFGALVQQWKKETGHFSIFEQKASHPAYQCIIELGEPLLPLLIDELKNSPRNWFWALRKIAKCNPVRPNATVQEAVMDWTEWWNHKNTKYGRVD